MKNIKNVLKGLMIIGVIAIGTLTGGQKANADTTYTESNNKYHIEQGEAIIEHNDGSYDVKYSDGVVEQYDKDNNFIFNIIDSYTTDDNGQLTEYSDGSFAYIDTVNNIYEFTPVSLGDWNYSFNNIGNLNKCILSYANCLNNNKSNCLYVINSYINDEGDTIVEYNDYSYTVVNYNDNYFEFVPSCTEDWSLYFENIKELNNCIATYKSIKETGMY